MPHLGADQHLRRPSGLPAIPWSNTSLGGRKPLGIGAAAWDLRTLGRSSRSLQQHVSRLDEVNALSHSKSAGRGTSADRAGALLPLLNDLLWEATVFTRTLEPSRGNLFRIQTRDWIVVDQRDALARLALTFVHDVDATSPAGS